MIKIYNELCKYNGKLTEFAKELVRQEVYANTKSAIQAMRFGTASGRVSEIYQEWKHGKLRTKDMAKHKQKLEAVFTDIKRRSIKDELVSIHEVLEYALMELTLGIKNGNKEQLLNVKGILQDVIYKEAT
ncbi:MAG: hypothetical protein EOM05_09800 [Clostridia bacterium]|nr:hypothetical protein [Clostridia bacterium]